MSLRLLDPDELWFKEHKDRKTHIRRPVNDRESYAEFLSLGDHDASRRYIIILKLPGRMMKIPFLAFADESIEDDDATLLPIVDGIMRDAAARYGVPTPGRLR